MNIFDSLSKQKHLIEISPPLSFSSSEDQSPRKRRKITPEKREIDSIMKGFYSEDSRIKKMEQIVASALSPPQAKDYLKTKLAFYDVENIRYSQRTISETTRDGTPLEELERNIKIHGWDENHPIQIVRMPDGKLTSFDNRRLFALKKIARERQSHEYITITAKISNFNEVADPIIKGSVFTQIENKENINKLLDSFKIIQKDTLGHCICARIHLTSKVHMERTAENPYGFVEDPIIMNPKLKLKHYFRGIDFHKKA